MNPLLVIIDLLRKILHYELSHKKIWKCWIWGDILPLYGTFSVIQWPENFTLEYSGTVHKIVNGNDTNIVFPTFDPRIISNNAQLKIMFACPSWDRPIYLLKRLFHTNWFSQSGIIKPSFAITELLFLIQYIYYVFRQWEAK